MKVWIDQNLCTGDGICCQIAPSVFFLAEDGLAYVIAGAEEVGEDVLEAVEESIAECPGECIFLEEK